MGITPEEVEHVARLSRLDLTPEEVQTFRDQLSVVLERAQRIQSLDLGDLPPTAHPVPMRNVLRPDVVVAPEPSERILDNAPERDGAFFTVPRIMEED
ncbi:MAG TPA: Asp-tRNA(Asn)/Glu-tRNA(Gln) amidotransferase subunit GatC [Actinomycetota bacterium]|nr:Asp-tRNA(Asn)/Glu-tRNA(Gln) amidotransferase subunit GatC [Actinomycetota bacterium]